MSGEVFQFSRRSSKEHWRGRRGFSNRGNSEKSERQRERRRSRSPWKVEGGEKGRVGGKFRGLALRRMSQRDRNARVAERMIPEHRGSGGQHTKVFQATMEGGDACSGGLWWGRIPNSRPNWCGRWWSLRLSLSARPPSGPGPLAFRLSTMPRLPGPLPPASSLLQPRRSISLSSSATPRSSPSLGQCEHS